MNISVVVPVYNAEKTSNSLYTLPFVLHISLIFVVNLITVGFMKDNNINSLNRNILLSFIPTPFLFLLVFLTSQLLFLSLISLRKNT